MTRRVHPRDLLDGRVTRRERRDQGVGVATDVARRLDDPGLHGFQPRRTLGVPAAGIVVRKARIGPDEQHVVHGTRRVPWKRRCRAAARPRGYARASPCRP